MCLLVCLFQYFNDVSFLSSVFHSFWVEVCFNTCLWSSVSIWYFFLLLFFNGYLQDLLFIFGFKQFEYNVSSSVLFLYYFGYLFCLELSVYSLPSPHSRLLFLITRCLLAWFWGGETEGIRGRYLFPWYRFSARQAQYTYVFEVVLSFAMTPSCSRQSLLCFFGTLEGEYPTLLQS